MVGLCSGLNIDFEHSKLWDAVKPETLSRFFRKAGFVINKQDIEEVLEVKEEDVDELNQMFERLAAAEETKGNLMDFLSADNDLATNQPMTLEEIAEANSQMEVGCQNRRKLKK
uniref:Uncharacterized protein n=1 Tax=Ditylenchus dipsaci TaxID=166011 RepID=A0A915EQN9_9BILA